MMLTIKEIAERLKVSQPTVRRWIREKRLKAIKMGDKMQSDVRIDEAEYDNFIGEIIKKQHYARHT